MQDSTSGQKRETVWEDRGSGGLALLRIYNRLGEATIYLHGAHIASFKARGEAELFFVSPRSVFAPGVPIRGGIPICFPWFGKHPEDPDLPLHGIVRTMEWQLIEQKSEADGSTTVTLGVEDSDETRALWHHRFRLTLAVNVGSALTIRLTVTNTDERPFSFDAALHTYYSVGAEVGSSVEGLDGLSAIDRNRGDEPFIQRGAATVNGAIHRLYRKAGGTVRLNDPAMGRSITMEQSRWSNILIWNPGEEAALQNREILDAWQDFLCVEHVNNGEGGITLDPGQSHTSELSLSVQR
ncbi:MAG: D-hexose-6-phosphate mutarotase [Spirochaetales bacterium]|jgi:glucose-6-phosphate 1-epimerase|nr:D-hexose-6-phosphate mutarotase [Spirochaetales bacterium]